VRRTGYGRGIATSSLMELVAELNPVEQEKKRRRSTERFIGLVVEPAIHKIEKREIQKEEA